MPEMLDWNSDMDAAPKDGTEIMLFYREYLGEKNFVVSGHWHIDEPFEEERTWEHSCGYGDADMWAELPDPPSPPMTAEELKEALALRDKLVMEAASKHMPETPLLAMLKRRSSNP